MKKKQAAETPRWPVTVTYEVLAGTHFPACRACGATWKRTDKKAALCPDGWHDEEGPLWKTFTLTLYKGDSISVSDDHGPGTSHECARIQVT